VAAVLALWAAGAAGAPAIPPPLGAPQAGERLRYEVRWLGIPIGTGELGVERANAPDGTPGFLLTARARSNEFLSAFCPVEDTIRSFLAEDGERALWSEKNLREGSYRAHERMDFDYARGVARYKSFTNGSEKEVPLEGPTHDVLSAFAWFRTRPVGVGETLRTRVLADEKNWTLEVRVLRAESLELRGRGARASFLVEPVAQFKGVFVRRGRAWVHFSADERRIPLKIRMNTPFGPVLGIVEEPPSPGAA
jgi:hypothetical protein